jgi:transcriptional regulator with XRE-family HTH domain
MYYQLWTDVMYLERADSMSYFPVINMEATGRNIMSLRKMRGMSVRELQRHLGFRDPQAIYKWQQGRSLPSVDNLVVLSCILDVPIDRILVVTTDESPVFHKIINILLVLLYLLTVKYSKIGKKIVIGNSANCAILAI